MTKHTPGPWKVSNAHPWIVHRDFSAIGCDDSGETICAANGHPNSGYFPTEPESYANARLIAAAPDLLDALENLCIGIGMGWDLEGMVEVAQKAIAKATGSVVAEKATGGGGE